MDFSTITKIFVISACVKILLIPSYRSTDFEVHRNWLAITKSLPIEKWYFDDTSEWTLDYPPLFAYFELFLAQFANYFDNNITKRLSVIFCDILLCISLWRYSHSACLTVRSAVSVTLLVIFNAGLVLVDNIHFQYNGYLFAILILTIDFANRGYFLLCATSFSILILSKHLFIPLIPIFAIYLIKSYCISNTNNEHTNENTNESTNASTKYPILLQFFRFFQLILCALLILLIAFGPFLYQKNGYEQIIQIFQRLFPFGRGLVHAYWAPNLWAIYIFIDKILYSFSKILKLDMYISKIGVNVITNSSSSGLIGNFTMMILPQITPIITLILLFISILPALYHIYIKTNTIQLIRGIVYCSLSAFMIGYHVHEKAILVPIITLTLIGGETEKTALLLANLCACGIFGIFPLFTTIFELPIKAFLYIMFITAIWSSFSEYFTYCSLSQRISRGGWMLIIQCFLFIFTEVIHPLLFINGDGTIWLPFLPRMMTSVICALELMYCWWSSLMLLWDDISDYDIVEEVGVEVGDEVEVGDSYSDDKEDDYNNDDNDISSKHEDQAPTTTTTATTTTISGIISTSTSTTAATSTVRRRRDDVSDEVSTVTAAVVNEKTMGNTISTSTSNSTSNNSSSNNKKGKKRD